MLGIHFDTDLHHNILRIYHDTIYYFTGSHSMIYLHIINDKTAEQFQKNDRLKGKLTKEKKS